MKLRSVLTSALAAGVMMTATSVSAANLKVLASWNKNIWPTYVVLDTFVKNVAKVGGDKVNLRISGPEVVPPFEQLQPVKSGVFDILFTHGVYHVGSKGLAAIADAMTADPVGKRSSGVWDSLDKFYQKTHSLKLLAISPSSTAGYHIFLKDPIKGGLGTAEKFVALRLTTALSSFSAVNQSLCRVHRFIPRSKKGLLMALHGLQPVCSA